VRYQLPIHSAYHGPIGSEKAKKLLREKGGKCFLIRYCDLRKIYLFTIVTSEQKIKDIHLEIDIEGFGFTLSGSQKNFKSIDKLIKYFQSNALSPTIRTIGKPCKDPKLGNCTVL